MALYNTSSSIGTVLNSLTNNITGGEFITFLFIIILLIIILVSFRLPVEVIAIVISPVLIVLMTYNSNFYVLGGGVLIVLAILMAQKFFIKI